MACAPSHLIPERGRPKAEINWQYVDSLLEGGCSGVEIASEIGINPNTLYARCVIDNNIEFSVYSQQKSAKGEAKLRMQQYRKALGLTEAGDNTMLVWLGKNRLNQREHKEDNSQLKQISDSISNALKAQSQVYKDVG